MSRSPGSHKGQRRAEFGRRQTGHVITITRGENSRSFTIQPWVGLFAGIVAVFLGFAYLGATAYLMYRDDIIGGTLARHARLQHAYEDRIAALRAQVDRVNSRQLIDQQALEARVADLVRRQDNLKDHSQRIAQLMDRASGLSGKTGSGSNASVPAAASSYAPAARPSSGPVPLGDTTGSVRPKPLESTPANGIRPLSRLDAATAVASVGAVDAELNRMLTEHVIGLDRVARTAETNFTRMERVAARLGVALPAAASPVSLPPATGGPLVPLTPNDLKPYVARAEQAIARLDGARNVLRKVPLAYPVPEDSVVTSTFGGRRDPFLGIDAMHTGIDFRGDNGDPVKVTAAGTVINADREGGYGLMVEVDHGNGLTTRYGHLSRIDVIAGDRLAEGEIVGRVGSTGRSTGPHLHYETRVRGEALNPAPYLEAGRQLRLLMGD